MGRRLRRIWAQSSSKWVLYPLAIHLFILDYIFELGVRAEDPSLSHFARCRPLSPDHSSADITWPSRAIHSLIHSSWASRFSFAQQDLWFNLTEWCSGPPRLELSLWRFSGKSRAEGTGTWINTVMEGGGVTDHSTSLPENAIHIQRESISISLDDRTTYLVSRNKHA